MQPTTQQLADSWIAAWNSHDIDLIMAHYADDVHINTPMIEVALGIESGTLTGQDAVRNYFEMALQKVPDLRFKLIDVTQGNDSFAIYYDSVMGKRAIEVMFLNESGLVKQMIAHYS